jgi:hypothetical protein
MPFNFSTPRPGNLHPKHPKPTIPPTHPGHGFQPLPKPTGSAPYHLKLEDVLPGDKIAIMNSAGKMVCHIMGDTGGVKQPVPQQLVANCAESDMQQDEPGNVPAFFYHLGDVVYYNGEAKEYYPQFYEPYDHYAAPIFAIPGNHDGDPIDATTPSLDAFVRNFCAKKPEVTHDNGGLTRTAMTEPNVYFTLLTPFATFVGLYTNVPEGGVVQKDQEDWFVGELKNAPKDLPLFVAMHHPPYSLDDHHSGSIHMHDLLGRAKQASKRNPDMVFAGHVHNYQRFTQSDGKNQTPYIVAGAGGYWNLHHMAKINGEKIIPPYVVPDSDVTLENYVDDYHGFLRLEITPDLITGRYFTAPHPQDPWSKPPKLADFFEFDWKAHKLNR